MIKIISNFKTSIRYSKYFRLNSLFYKLFMSVIIIVVAFTTLNIMGIFYIKNILVNQEMKTQKLYLDYNSMFVDNLLGRIKDAFYVLEYDSDVNNFIRLYSKDSINYDRYATNVIKKVSSIKVNMQELESIYIYHPRIDSVLESSGVSDSEVFYKNRYTSDHNYWEKMIQNQKEIYIKRFSDISNNVASKGKSVNELYIVKSIQLGNKINGSMVAVINNNLINKLFSRNEYSRHRRIYLVDQNQNILFSNTQEPIPSNYLDKGKENDFIQYDDKFVISSKKSTFSGVYYFVLTPSGVVFKDLDKISYIALITVIFLMLGGSIFSLYVSQKFYFPLSNIIDYFGAHSYYAAVSKNKIDEIGYIKQGIDKISSDNTYLKDSIKENKGIVYHYSLFRLLIGECDESSFLQLIKGSDIVIVEGIYRVLIIRAYIKKEGEIKVLNFYKKIKEYLGEWLQGIFNLGNDDLVLLVCCNKQIDMDYMFKRLFEYINEIETMQDQYGLMVGIGGQYKDIFQSKKSFDQALHVLNTRGANETNNVLEYDEIQREQKSLIYLPHDFEQVLFNNILAGNTNFTSEYIRNIMDNNLNKGISYVTFTKISYSIENVIRKVLNDREFDGYDAVKKQIEFISKNMNNFLNGHFLKEQIAKTLILLTDINYQNKQKNNEIKKIIDYVDNNFNRDINLEIVADKFGYNPNYLSKVFKQSTSMSFTDYLNTAKLKLAKKLLQETELKILEISEKVGYNSTNIFIRTFKKMEGTSPGEYKKNIKINL